MRPKQNEREESIVRTTMNYVYSRHLANIVKRLYKEHKMVPDLGLTPDINSMLPRELRRARCLPYPSQVTNGKRGIVYDKNLFAGSLTPSRG